MRLVVMLGIRILYILFGIITKLLFSKRSFFFVRVIIHCKYFLSSVKFFIFWRKVDAFNVYYHVDSFGV